MKKIVLCSYLRGREFDIMTADFFLNWLTPYIKNHKYIKNMSFNRSKSEQGYFMILEFDCYLTMHFLRFANDLQCLVETECAKPRNQFYISDLVFSS